ncbi:MAG TPA: hypothetical protein EYP24_02435, partial [bacterium (Candidatus Stahlbacteria)]|nr:hypothetical protein [Candidatus Stahlbacteria bacterium]
SIQNLSLKRRNSKVNLRGDVDIKKRSYKIDGSGRVYGPDLEPFFSGLKGHIDIRLAADGSLPRMKYYAEIRLREGAYGDLSDLSLDVRIKPDSLQIDDMRFKIRESDFRIAGRVINFKSPDAVLTLRSKKLNLDQLPGGKGEGGKRQVLPISKGRVEFDIGHLIIQGNDLTQVKGAALYQNNRFQIQRVQFQAYGGKGSGKGEIDLSQRPPYQFEVRARDLDARRLFQKFLGISNITGKFRTRLKTEGIGFGPEDIRRNLSCDGYIALLKGEIRDFGFTNKLLEWLKITKEGRFPYKDINATIKIRKGKVRFDDVLVQTRTADYLLFGTLGFDGRIDYRITVTFNREVSKRLKRLHADWLFYTDPRGRVVIDIFAKGTITRPRFSLDKKRIQMRIKKKIRGNWEKKKQDIIKKVKGLFG